MKRSFGLLSIASIAVAGLMVLSIQAGCASDEDPDDTAGTGGGSSGSGGSAANGGSAGSTGGSAGSTGGSAGGTTGGSGGGLVGQEATIADIADGTVASGIAVEVTGAIATTDKMVISYNKNSGSCTWAVFLKDPNADRGTMVVSKGDDGPTDGAPSDCPLGTDAIPDDVVKGDILTIVGETDTYAPSNCTAEAQIQIEASTITKTGSGAAPDPVVVTDMDTVALGGKAYQGLLIKIENVDAENYDGGTVGPYGIIELDGTDLHVRDDFYWRESGGPEYGPSQHFNSIVGLVHLHYTCDWALQPRDKCTDFDPASDDCL